VVVGDFNTAVSPIDRSSKQKINNEILEQNDTIDEVDLTDVYRILHQHQHNIHSSQPIEHSPK
jgi:hypothetical protein